MRAILVLVLAILPAFAEPAPAVETRTFDVRALVEEPGEPSVPALDLEGGVLEFLDPAGELPEPPRFLDQYELLALVGNLVDPGSWAEDDGSLDLTNGWLHATAAPETLDRLARFLDALWAEASRRVEVPAEWALLSAAAADRLGKSGALAALRRGRVDAGVRGAVLDEAAKDGGLLLAGTAVTRSGRLATIRQTTSTSYVADIAVEIASGSRVGDPIVRFAPEGWYLAVRPTVLTDGSVLVETIHQTAALDGPIRRISVEAEPLGTLDLPALGIERFSGAARARPGETVAMVREGGRGPHPLAVLLLTPRVTGGPATPGPVAHLPARALLGGRTALRAGFPAAEGESDDEQPLPPDLFLSPRPMPRCESPLFSSTENLVEFVAARLSPEERPDASPAGLFLPADDARVPGVREVLAGLEDSAGRTFRARVALEDRSASGEVRNGSALHLSVPAGAAALFQAGTERAFLADWDVEVAQESRVGDPQVRHAFGGLVAILRVDPAPSGHAFTGSVTIVLTDLDPAFELRRAGIDQVGVIEVPRSRQVVVNRDFAGAPGEAIVLDAGRRPDGSRLAITLTVEAE